MMYRRIGVAFLLRALAAVSLVAVAGLARAQSRADQPAEGLGPPPVSLSAVIDQVKDRFPPVAGEVVEVRGKDVTLSIGRRDGVQVGLALSVYRLGREIRNPKTGELLGRIEEPLGRATVSQVFDTLSIAAFDGKAVQTGDRVRVGDGGKAKLTLLVFRGGIKDDLAEAVTHELYSGLVDSGRFEVVLGDQIAVWLTQQRIPLEAFLQGTHVAEAAARFTADNILVLSFKTVNRKAVMMLRLFSQPRPDPALSTAVFVPPSIKPRTPGQFSASDRPREVRERKPRSMLARLLGRDVDPGAYSSADSSVPLQEVARFGFPVVAMDLAVPGDHVPRLAISDGNRVFMYRIVNRTLEADWTYSKRQIGRVVSLYLADLAGNGSLEVVVNRYDPKLGVNSLILAAKDGKPTELVAGTSSMLIALDEKGSGVKQTLWAQEYSSLSVFAEGAIERVAVRDGQLVSLGRVSVPTSFRATGATMANIMGKGSRTLVYVDEYHRLRITSGNEEIWRSSSAVSGGSYLELQAMGYDNARGTMTRSTSMAVTPLPVDLDGDGIDEVVVPQNQVPGMLAVIFRGPTGIRFQQVNSGFEGTITGLGAIPSDEGGQPVLVACVVHFKGLLSQGGETQVIMTTPE